MLFLFGVGFPLVNIHVSPSFYNLLSLDFLRTLTGGSPKNKMENFDGIFLEGGGGSIKVFEFFLLKTHLESLPDCRNEFCTQFELYIIVVEVTLNRAEYGSQQSDQPENVNFEDLKVIFLTETKCKIRFINM